MKFINEKVIKEEIEKGIFLFKDLKIGEKNYTLNIVNSPLISDEKNFLSILFNCEKDSANPSKADYSIFIDEKGISFSRHVYRPNHDHDDFETLQVVIRGELTGRKKGELVWRDDSPVPTERTGYANFYIQFGSEKVNY